MTSTAAHRHVPVLQLEERQQQRLQRLRQIQRLFSKQRQLSRQNSTASVEELIASPPPTPVELVVETPTESDNEEKEEKVEEERAPPTVTDTSTSTVATATAAAAPAAPVAPNKGSGTVVLDNRFLVYEPQHDTTLRRCVHKDTREEYVCKIASKEVGNSLMSAHFRLDSSWALQSMYDDDDDDLDKHVSSPCEVIVGTRHTYLIYPKSYGDLHSYVRSKGRLGEPEAIHLFRQIARAVRSCHHRGLVLRDLKLRKFVFRDPERTELHLETLEDAVVLPVDNYENDSITGTHGCPAYVSPERLRTTCGNQHYSGRHADMWGVGIMLYAMLVGRYPFNDTEHPGLFAKIRRGQYTVPEWLSGGAKCLIRCLLRQEPSERITAHDVVYHPWLRSVPVVDCDSGDHSRKMVDGASSKRRVASHESGEDQVVPCLPQKRAKLCQ